MPCNQTKTDIVMIQEKQKEVYSSPTTEALEFSVEGVMCQSPTGGFGEDPIESNQSGFDWGY